MATHPNISEYIGVTPKSEFDLAEIVEHGLPTDNLALLREKGLTFSEVSQMVISPRTLKHRKARGEHLSHEETDRMVRVARIVALAENVFGNLEKALLWLRGADDRIGDRNQLSMLHTEYGARGSVGANGRGENWDEKWRETRLAGDSWVARTSSALLVGPSAASPESFNYLFNPLHSDAKGLTIEWSRWIEYDKRLFHTI